jgi:hypothetical protein
MRNKETDQSNQSKKTAQKRDVETEDVKFHLERLQLENDLAKHIATLDTASILIVTTFLEKLSANPARKELVGLALAGFIVSLIGVLVYEFALVMEASGRVYRQDLEKTPAYLSRMLTQGSGVAIGFTCFVGGLISLAIFAFVNL